MNKMNKVNKVNNVDKVNGWFVVTCGYDNLMITNDEYDINMVLNTKDNTLNFELLYFDETVQQGTYSV